MVLSTFAWVVIISISVFMMLLLTIGVIIIVKLGNRKNVHGVILLKSGSQAKIRFHRIKDRIKTYNGQKYVFDELAVVKTTYKDFIYFMEGNPKPIIYDFKSNKPEIVSQDLKNILDSDLVQKLFSDEDMKLLKLLVIINLILGVLILIILCYNMFNGATLKNNEENYALIYNATRNAIIGV
jgi:hypothetical protein